MTDTGDSTTPPDGADDIIRPIGYRPREAVREKRFPLTRWQLVLICVAVPVLVVIWFLFTAKSVRLEFTPPVELVGISGGLSFELGGVYLLRQGEYQLQAQAAGYYPLAEQLSIQAASNQTYTFTLTKLPGQVTFESDPEGAEIALDGMSVGYTPTPAVEVAAGPQLVTFRKDRYLPLQIAVEVDGMLEPQTVRGALQPGWADVAITTQPAGAEVFVDDQATGLTTPANVEIMAGEREVRLSAAGHRSHRQRILVAPLEQISLGPIILQQADGLLHITTRPASAGVTLNGEFHGETPLELAVRSGTRYRLQIFKAGFAPVDRSLTVASGEDRALNVNLRRLLGDVSVVTQPPQAQLYIDGKLMGDANQTLHLPTFAHKLEIRLDGFAGYTTDITPRNGLTQEVRVRLLTLEEARLAALKPSIRTSLGQELVLLEPAAFTMGASRRQPGRRANETLRDVDLNRLFYLATQEVTNEEFRAFASGHQSGEFEDHDLSKGAQPVSTISWDEAALYCNWLSETEDLPRFYITEFGKVIGINPSAIGYRLPTEAEWAWSARQVDAEPPVRFPWGGNLPPPDRHGNYADRTAAHLVGRIIFGFNDNYIVAAPVGTFEPNIKGLYDLSGNVSEWVNDHYEIPGPDVVTDPLGPPSGDYHVIRGSSWMHGTITELRISFRDYGTDGRRDLGFRLARFAEPH